MAYQPVTWKSLQPSDNSGIFDAMLKSDALAAEGRQQMLDAVSGFKTDMQTSNEAAMAAELAQAGMDEAAYKATIDKYAGMGFAPGAESIQQAQTGLLDLQEAAREQATLDETIRSNKADEKIAQQEAQRLQDEHDLDIKAKQIAAKEKEKTRQTAANFKTMKANIANISNVDPRSLPAYIQGISTSALTQDPEQAQNIFDKATTTYFQKEPLDVGIPPTLLAPNSPALTTTGEVDVGKLSTSEVQVVEDYYRAQAENMIPQASRSAINAAISEPLKKSGINKRKGQLNLQTELGETKVKRVEGAKIDLIAEEVDASTSSFSKQWWENQPARAKEGSLLREKPATTLYRKTLTEAKKAGVDESQLRIIFNKLGNYFTFDPEWIGKDEYHTTFPGYDAQEPDDMDTKQWEAIFQDMLGDYREHTGRPSL